MNDPVILYPNKHSHLNARFFHKLKFNFIKIYFVFLNAFVGAFFTWRTHMRRVFADCRVSGVVHTRTLRNCA